MVLHLLQQRPTPVVSQIEFPSQGGTSRSRSLGELGLRPPLSPISPYPFAPLPYVRHNLLCVYRIAPILMTNHLGLQAFSFLAHRCSTRTPSPLPLPLVSQLRNPAAPCSHILSCLSANLSIRSSLELPSNHLPSLFILLHTPKQPCCQLMEGGRSTHNWLYLRNHSAWNLTISLPRRET